MADSSARVHRARSRRRAAMFRENELRLLLLAGDAVAAAAAAYGAPALWATFDREFVPTSGLPIWQLSFPLVWAGTVWLLNRGDIASPRFGRRSISVVTQSLLAALGLTLAWFFFAPFFVPRGATLLMLPLAGALTLGGRFLYLRLLSTRLLDRRVVMVGTDEAAQRVARFLLQPHNSIPYTLLAFVGLDERSSDSLLGVPLLDGRDLWDTLLRLDTDLIVVGHTRAVRPTLLAELVQCFEHGVEAVPATALYEQLAGRVLVSALEADWYAELPTHRRGLYLPIKRLVDVVIAAFAGLLLLPIMIAISLAVLLESGRPILLRQVRIGQRGDPFIVHKFRSMRADAEPAGPVWAAVDDPRRTRVGRVLRRYRLDEWPQLWDVLRGSMSLIGPRPERPEFVAQLSADLPLYRARALMRPGITGWAQVQYPYAASVEENLAKLEYDLYYLRHFGPLLDFSIALRTITLLLGLSRVSAAHEAPTR